MQDVNLQPLFDYLDENLGEIKQDIQTLKLDISDLKTAVANLSAQVKSNHEETLILVHRMDRNEAWMRQVSNKLGIPVPF